MKQMPIPRHPRVSNYGKREVGNPHDIRLYPAIIREKSVLQAESLMEDGQSSCFFHANLPAVAVCDISGRLICNLCKTEWQGKTVSFASLQSLMGKGSKEKNARDRILWDDIALALALIPLLVYFVTIITAPITLGLCLWFWRKGPTSIVRQSRWRYIVAGLVATAEIAVWLWFIFDIM